MGSSFALVVGLALLVLFVVTVSRLAVVRARHRKVRQTLGRILVERK